MYITYPRGMSGVTSQPLGRRNPVARGMNYDVPLLERREMDDEHTLSGGIFQGGLGDTAPVPPAQVPPALDSKILSTLDKRTSDILRSIEEQNKARKIALMIAAASAVFAAVKLGIIALPHIRARVRGSKGVL